ncbi:hypothetical protein [Tenacibaculum ascidiaceicola]|uniref:hypothetical protein n=1 Tax=Tenacibaculum ascidiaceicola TaxID=1699411 RepID=UPI003CE54435
MIKNNSVTDTSFSSFLQFPLLLKNISELKLINTDSFKVVTRIARNRYSDSITYSKDFDTIRIYSFKNGDTIEFFQNRYTKKITLLNLSSNRVTFSNGGHIGMSLSSFENLFNLKIAKKDSSAVYKDEFTEVRFLFKNGKLTKILYKNALE